MSDVLADTTLADLLDEFEIRTIPTSTNITRPRECKCVEALQRVLQVHGARHLRIVLMILCETHPRSALAIVHPVVQAVSGILAMKWDDLADGDLLVQFDAIDLEYEFARTASLSGKVPRHLALMSLLADRLGLMRPKASRQRKRVRNIVEVEAVSTCVP